MGSLADYFARRLWWWMLWSLRRPWIKRWQRAAFGLNKHGIASHPWQSFKRQNTFARRWGLFSLGLTVRFFLVSLSLTVGYMAISAMADRGLFTLPDSVQERMARP